MNRRSRRLDPLRLLPLAVLASLACEDSPTRSTYVSIVEPLRMSWRDQNVGVPYFIGETALFEARTTLRVAWTFRIEGYPLPPDGRQPLFKTTFPFQDRITFSWKGTSSLGSHDFAFGDSCIATISFPQLDPAEADRARVVFVVGRSTGGTEGAARPAVPSPGTASGVR